jgi:hypothetical protein
MSRRDPPFKPPSLTQHFEAPDEYVGCFGWLCGYSADASFLEEATERFSRRSAAQRAYEGRISLALMLDPGNPQILPGDVPGVLHLPLKAARPFRLLHAKVALLGFRHATAEGWQLRLIVSTGNWTRGTLEESLDLAWRLDLVSEDLRARDDDVRQACADLAAAWNLITWLQNLFDTRALTAAHPDRPPAEPESNRVAEWVARASKYRRGQATRFFDNREDSLLARLPRLIEEQASGTSRNYLAMGSGFYEAASADGEVPVVLAEIVEQLRENGLLAKSAEIDVFVNPKACQAVAGSVSAITASGWTVRRAGKPDYFKTARSLHAKFLFGATCKGNSPLCNSPWLYLGSGNLTAPGFTNPMALEHGNLEAGVVFSPGELYWSPGKRIPDEALVTNLLPLQWESDVGEDQVPLEAGGDMPPHQTRFAVGPVACLFWRDVQTGQWLWPGTTDSSVMYEVLDDSGLTCRWDPPGGFEWHGPRPRQVRLRWLEGGDERAAWVPVIDEFGRVAAATLPSLDLDQAWGQLAHFPIPPDDEELPADGDVSTADSEAAGPLEQAGPLTPVKANYSVRQMMQLVENIAAKQTAVARADWATWCLRLEQSLVQATGSPVLAEFKALDLNPLSPLREPPFRPDFASITDSVERRQYEGSLARVEAAWGVGGLKAIGGEE